MVTDVQRQHPLVDDVDGDVVVTRSDREIVALTPLRADLLIACRAADRRVRLVTPATSRLTEPMRDALSAAAGSWVVEDGQGWAWDGLLGLDATSTEPRIAPPFARPIDMTTLQLIVAVSLRHRAEPGARIGPALEAVARLGETPGIAGWGPHEPVEYAWDPRGLTAHLAARLPDEARVVVTGPAFMGSTVARRTDKGVEEVLQGLVAVGQTGADTTDRRLRGVPAALAALADDALPLFASVLARPGRTDLTTAPFLQAPPVPVALLIGAPGVRDLGLDAADFTSRFGALTVGRPRIPGLVIPFTGPDGGWPAFERVIAYIGQDRIRRVLGTLPTPPET